jgi:putative SOS response-associated peptidase YedK
MCGRFTLATPPEILTALFGVAAADWNDPRYNIAPQTRVVTVRGARGQRTAQSLIWGADNPRDPRPLINARSETVATSPLFGRAFAASRVLVPADGFFEWTKEAGRRRAHYFQQPQGAPFAFAGIAVSPSAAHPPGGPAAVILTAKASPSVALIHDRMPLIVTRSDFETWLEPEANPKTVLEMMAAGARTEWTSWPVGPLVNNVRNDGPENIRPARAAAPPQGRLF